MVEAKRFSEERAKFYTAQIVIALGYLHNSKVIYRDLKPENVLISADGYIMMADFGLAKVRIDEQDPNSFCGTPEYLCMKFLSLVCLAPEMIEGTGHDHTLDWWALGVLLYVQ